MVFCWTRPHPPPFWSKTKFSTFLNLSLMWVLRSHANFTGIICPMKILLIFLYLSEASKFFDFSKGNRKDFGQSFEFERIYHFSEALRPLLPHLLSTLQTPVPSTKLLQGVLWHKAPPPPVNCHSSPVNCQNNHHRGVYCGTRWRWIRDHIDPCLYLLYYTRYVEK